MKNTPKTFLKSMATPPLLGLFLLFTPWSHALSLNEYLQQVESQSPGLNSAKKAVEGASVAEYEGKLIYKPRLTFSYQHLLDRRLYANPAFQGNRTTQDQLSLGLEKQFDFGMTGRISHNIINNTTEGLNALFFPNGINQFTQGLSQLEVNLPLWKNLMGSETKAQATLQESSQWITYFSENIRLKSLRATAEFSYYRLALARNALELQGEVLDRAKRISEWAKKRVRNQIADRVDALQAESAYQMREIEYQSAKEEVANATSQFNLMRKESSQFEVPALSILTTDDYLNLKIPERLDQTDEEFVAEHQRKISNANHTLAKEKTLPDVSLFSTVAFNGLNRFQSVALSDSLTTKNPMYMVGVKLSIPLSISETSDIRKGRTQQMLAAEELETQKRLENVQAYQDFARRIRDAQKRLGLIEKLVQAQKEKVEYERYRLGLGRTTTYQLLTFEQDYAQSLINRTRIEQEILSLYAQIKPFSKEGT